MLARIHRHCSLALLTIGLCALGAAARAQTIRDSLGLTLTKPPISYVAPGRLFALQVPGGWEVVAREDDTNVVEFRAVDRPGDGVLTVRRVSVPEGAHPRQLVLNALEQRLNKLANFKLVARRDLKIGALKGASVVGTYSYQGNVQYPLALEEVYVVTGAEAFVFHFEAFEPLAAGYSEDLDRFYGTFKPRP